MRSRLGALLLLATATLSPAQAPSAWTGRTFSSTVQLAQIMQRGKVLAYQDGATVHAYSALTRSWHSVAASTSAQFHLANDLLLVADGARISAFASYTGRFETVTVSANAQVVNPAGQKNDSIYLVHDGNELLAVSGFVGKWTRRAVGPSAQFAVQRHVAVVADGNRLAGMSAFHGTWTTTTFSGGLGLIAADGSVGAVMTSSGIFGFSALREAWAVTPNLSGNAQFRIGDDVATWWDGITYVGFSGLRGSFSRVTTGLQLTVEVSDQLVVAHDDTRFWVYAAPAGAWTAQTFATTPLVIVEASVLLLLEASTAHGFSALQGTFRSTAIQSNDWRVSAAVAAVLDVAGKGTIYSALLGTWSAIPASAAGNIPQVASTGALVAQTNGFYAFSARTGSYVPLVTGSGAVGHVDSGSAILAVEDGRTFHILDPRRGVWLHESLLSSGLQVDLWRTCLAAKDGTSSVLGFGAFHGRFERHAVSGAVRELSCNSESARVVTDATIYAFSAVPLLSTPWQFPEFRRTFTTGTKLDIHLSAASSTGHAYLALGVQPPFALPGLGDVLLDAAVLLPITVPLDARAGTARTSLDVPDLPGLRGMEVFMQALVIPGTGLPYVTDLASVLLH